MPPGVVLDYHTGSISVTFNLRPLANNYQEYYEDTVTESEITVLVDNGSLRVTACHRARKGEHEEEICYQEEYPLPRDISIGQWRTDTTGDGVCIVMASMQKPSTNTGDVTTVLNTEN